MTEVVADKVSAEDKTLANTGATVKDVQSGSKDGIPKQPVDNTGRPTKEQLDEKHGEKEAPKAKTPEELRQDAAEAKKTADAATAAQSEEWKNEYVTLDHPAAQAAIDVLKENNVSPVEANDIFKDAIEKKDISLVKWADLEKKIGPAKTALVKAGITQFDNEVVSKVKATVTAAYEIVGSEQNWETIKTWAQATEKTDAAFAGKIAEYRKAIELGGWAAQQAVTALKNDYNAAPGNKGLGVTKLVQGGKAVPAGLQTISKADYLKEMKALHDRNAPSNEIATLRQRRLASRSAGVQ